MNKEEYLKIGGVICPFCGDGDIEGGFVQVESGQAWQKITCLACGKRWNDIYTLTDIEEID